MPELPEIEALVDHLRRHAVGLTIGRVDVAALSALKTFDPPINVLHGQTVVGAQRWGKYLGLQSGQLFLIAHLSRAGWLRWSDNLAPAPLRPRSGAPGLAPPVWRPHSRASAGRSPRQTSPELGPLPKVPCGPRVAPRRGPAGSARGLTTRRLRSFPPAAPA